MNCHTCGYALWNLRTRQCPECGRGFRPSEYRFVPSSVRFMCPHCEQAYFGTDEHGQLSPRAFECSGCHKQIDVDATVLLPAEGVAEGNTSPGGVAWIDRRNRGRIRSFVQTIGAALVHPWRMMRNLPLNAPTGDILTFGMIATTLSMLAGPLPLVWIIAWQEMWWYFDGLEVVWFYAAYVLGPLLVAMAIAPLLAAITHIGLRITGGCAYGADRTFQAFGAAAGASVVCAVPVCGWALGWFWWAGSMIAALSAAQRVHPARAALAVLLVPILLAGTLATVAVLSYAHRSREWQRWQDPVVRMTSAVNQFLWQGGGEPVHAVELLLFQSWQFDPNQSDQPFCHPNTRTSPANIPIGAATLRDFTALARHERMAAIQSYLESLPENLVAHRFGDYVFTYHAGPLNSYDSRFWVLVMLPDPESNDPPTDETEVFLGLGDYSSQAISFADLPRELEAQNRYRAVLGLPPLPDLTTVTHNSPAVAAEDDEKDEDDE